MSDKNIDMSISEKNNNVLSVPTDTKVEEKKPEIPKVQLTLEMLLNIRSIVELSVRRGAFQANEIKQIGEIYENYSLAVNYLQSQVAQQQQTNK